MVHTSNTFLFHVLMMQSANCKIIVSLSLHKIDVVASSNHSRYRTFSDDDWIFVEVFSDTFWERCQFPILSTLRLWHKPFKPKKQIPEWSKFFLCRAPRMHLCKNHLTLANDYLSMFCGFGISAVAGSIMDRGWKYTYAQEKKKSKMQFHYSLHYPQVSLKHTHGAAAGKR